MDYGNTKTLSMHRRLGSATLSQLAFPGEGNPNFLWEKSHWDNTVVKSFVCLFVCLFVFWGMSKVRVCNEHRKTQAPDIGRFRLSESFFVVIANRKTMPLA